MSTLTTSAAKGAQKGIEKVTASPVFWVVSGLATVGLGYFVYKKGRGIFDSINQRAIERQADTNKKDPRASYAVEFAQRLQAAMYGWGTDEDEMYKVAQEMKAKNVPFSMVADAFRKLFNNASLTKWINDDLASEEIAKFYSYLRGFAGLLGTGYVALLGPPPAQSKSTIPQTILEMI
jgi:hypothetical protein